MCKVLHMFVSFKDFVKYCSKRVSTVQPLLIVKFQNFSTTIDNKYLLTVVAMISEIRLDLCNLPYSELGSLKSP